MSHAAGDDPDVTPSEPTQSPGDAETDTDADGQPEIEADLFEEELRIDGICGVY